MSEDEHDAEAEYRELIRREHDRQRRTLLAALPLAFGAPGLIVVFGVVITGLAQGVWLWITIAGGLVAVGVTAWGAIQLHAANPDDRTLALAKRTDWIDEAQRGRVYAMLYTCIFAFIFIPLGLSAAGDMVSGEGNAARAINALIALFIPMVQILMLTGRDGGITKKMRKYLDDEHTRALRARACGTGLAVAMAAASGVYLIGLWQAEVAVVLMLPVLFAGSFAAVIHYGLLERRAERGG
jgi:predicted nucleic acid-binding Zn ribbon protein